MPGFPGGLQPMGIECGGWLGGPAEGSGQCEVGGRKLMRPGADGGWWDCMACWPPKGNIALAGDAKCWRWRAG